MNPKKAHYPYRAVGATKKTGQPKLPFLSPIAGRELPDISAKAVLERAVLHKASPLSW